MENKVFKQANSIIPVSLDILYFPHRLNTEMNYQFIAEMLSYSIKEFGYLLMYVGCFAWSICCNHFPQINTFCSYMLR